MLFDCKLYYKAIVTKALCYQDKHIVSMEQSTQIHTRVYGHFMTSQKHMGKG